MTDIDTLAQQWASMEEFALDGFSIEDVEKILKEMIQLAKSAEEQNKALFLWTAL